jgi:DnaJ family protein C protein 9
MTRKTKAKPVPVESNHSEDETSNHGTTEELLQEEPPSVDPYAVLEVSQDANADQIKSAYRKLALKSHPDKVSPEKRDAAHKKFQEIAFAYAILSDERRRKRYDATGNTAESATLEDDDFNWTDFFRDMSAQVVSGELIDQVKNEYQGSDEEKADVLAAYEEFEGDMDGVFETVMCSEVLADEDRFRKMINAAIKNGEVESFDKYTKEGKKGRDKRKARAKAEEQEAMEMAREMGIEDKLFGKKGKAKGKKSRLEDDNGALAALIQQRQKSRAENFFDDMEAKYGGGAKTNKRKAADEPPQDAFAKNRKKSAKA